MKQQTERGEKYFSKNSNAASLFAPPKMPGSSMGKSVLLYDEASGQKQTNSMRGNNGEEAVLNMDLMQKQQMQKNLILNQEVFLIVTLVLIRNRISSFLI